MSTAFVSSHCFRSLLVAFQLISAREISFKMLKRIPISLNEISHNAAMELVSLALDGGAQITKVFVDTVGDPENYQRKLTKAFDGKIEFVVDGVKYSAILPEGLKAGEQSSTA